MSAPELESVLGPGSILAMALRSHPELRSGLEWWGRLACQLEETEVQR